METPINPKSTKNEILAAYENLLKQIRAEKKEEQPSEQATKERNMPLKHTDDVSFEGIVKSIADQKISLTSSLDKLENQLLERFKQLTALQEAVANQEKYLNELYSIKANADSLAALIEAQKVKKMEFERELSELQRTFDAKKVDFERELKEYNDKTQRERKREEEEYRYNIAISRKKEADVYEEKKLKLDKDLQEKRESFEREVKEFEASKAEIETELAELRKRAKDFPHELESAVKQAEINLEQRLQVQFSHERELSAQKTENELKLRDQTITTLKDKIKEQEQLIKQLSEKATIAENSVKDIAIKALESSSSIRVLEKTKESRE